MNLTCCAQERIFLHDHSEIPETIHEFEDDDDDIVLNGRTLDDLNMKRGTENGIKYFLKDVVRTHIKMANGKQASMSVYDLVSPLKKQVLRQEIDNGSEQENDSGTQNSNEGLDMKTVVETEKVDISPDCIIYILIETFTYRRSRGLCSS